MARLSSSDSTRRTAGTGWLSLALVMGACAPAVVPEPPPPPPRPVTRDDAAGPTAPGERDPLAQSEAVPTPPPGSSSLPNPAATPAPTAGGPARGRPEPGQVREMRPAFQARSAAPPVAAIAGLGYLGDVPSPAPPSHDTEGYDHIAENAFQRVADAPLSTFSIDVDSASWANVRRFLGQGRLPPPDAVRIEEMINYFRLEYPEPEGDAPFAVSTDVAACPWQPRHRLVSIGLQGRRIPREQLPPLNLVFLLDVSGSMNSPDKLPLLKAAMRLLVAQLSERDSVAIAVYAGSSGLVLPPTPGHHRTTILEALDRLQAGGSTAGAAGIQLAYEVAQRSFKQDGVNRVLLATDGDFNVGVSSQGELVRLIEAKREAGVSLSVLGFGTGNLKDSTMEQLANHGNGNYGYIDSLHEARKVLVAEAGGTLVTIAKDVKLQLEFNPRAVSAYRLIGYENRVLAAQDFNDDRKDAGEIGAGHSVTALYEVVPVGVPLELPGVDPLRYQAPRPPAAGAGAGELLTVKLRHKAPEGGPSRLQQHVVRDAPAAALRGELRFAAAVAAFGMLLRGSEHAGEASFGMVVELAEAARGADPEGHRSEFVRLVRLAESLAPVEDAQVSRH